ncbi:Aste57867_9194 [Aphanomyces stellatus]|uniref:Aste57867_9194 protein n=1 Tax=Aphanomyces stellatus TaxID=120398 RepID=A0A485KME2_9STRA|nr:hypothetical protein As57867_009158 [Aphanomyces stellatus]VFT86077.1 Aste57867_9194 [Aphanomyces stellatus]
MPTTTKQSSDDRAYAQVVSPVAAATASNSDRPHPMASANWLSRMLLLWLDPLVWQGAREPLAETDVWPIPPAHTAARLAARFRVHYPARSFFWALVHTFRPEIASILGLYVISAALSLVQPLVIKSFLQYLQGSPTTDLGISSGYALAALLTLLTFASVTITDQGMVQAGKLGCHAKVLAMDTVFHKALASPSSPSSSSSSGDVVTLASVDSQRLFMCGLWFMWVVVSPVTLLTIFVLIGLDLGAFAASMGGLLMLAMLAFGSTESAALGAIQKQIMVIQGERVKCTNELLHGVRAVKLYGWEAPLQAHIQAIRARELDLHTRYHTRRQVSSIALLVAPVVSLALCLVVFVARGGTLTSPLAFITLAYVNAARMPCNSFSFATMNLFDAMHSCRRLDAYLDDDETTAHGSATSSQDDDTVSSGSADASAIAIHHASFQWPRTAANGDATSSTATEDTYLGLRDIQLAVALGSLTVVVGAVGSGKSSLLQAILGEMPRMHGTCDVHGRVAYVSQEPWLQNATVRANVLFTDDVDTPNRDDVIDRYDHVLAACALQPDLAVLVAGDATEIGERGINLSGGQKARVALARAAFQAPSRDIYLLDDPLSALDVHVASAVFRDCIRGLLHDKTVVLTLNSHYHLLPHADRILIMDGGAIVGDGVWNDALLQQFPHLHPSAQGGTPRSATTKDMLVAPTATSPTTDKPSTKTTSSSLVMSEERAVGAVTSRTYVTYFDASGWNGVCVAASVLGAFTLAQTALVVLDWFMGYWAHQTPLTSSSPSSSSSSLPSSTTYAGMYMAMAVVATLLVLVRSVYVLHFILLCSKHLHATILNHVLHAPIPSFFDVTPVGRILNRFSSDLSQVDNMVPMLGLHIFGLVFQILASLVVCAATSPYVLLVYVPLVAVLARLRTVYSASSNALKRMDSVSRSPVLNLLSEVMTGGATIRAFDAVDAFYAKHRAAIDANQAFDMLHFISTKWFQMRLDWVSVVVVGAVSFLAIATSSRGGGTSSTNVTATGLALTYAIQLTIVLSRTTMEYTYMENVMTCAERLQHYTTLDTEGQDRQAYAQAVADTWPQHGAITFHAYAMRYRDNLDLVLQDVSFTVAPGEKVGICGRTGSGKSSLMAALFRTVEAASGCIRIDDVDIATLDLHTLRSRLTIIPQDPVLFSGSLRFNLDPSLDAADDQLWRVLKQVHLTNVVCDQGGLDFHVAEKGSNLSVGQRQLVCIARALLRRSRVVVLDEATANIDIESDRLIQETLKTCFDGVTMLVIAHRLDTILDSDRILVMQDGGVLEFGAPDALLARPESAFAALATQSKL